jgi:uncharacterized protein YjbI with pentapeptide repeats
MQRCKFNGSNLSGLFLRTNNVGSCDFSGSEFATAISRAQAYPRIYLRTVFSRDRFLRSNIERCDFSGANLEGAKISKSCFYGCDFTGTDFTLVSIKSSSFTGEKSKETKNNSIVGAKWNHTSFIGTQIADIVFNGTMDDCYFENCGFTRVTFQNVTLINTFFKNNEKLNKIRFVDCKADRMTYEFLKQGKADLSGITLITSNGKENEY